MTATITVLVHSMNDACLCSIGIWSGHLMIQSPRLPIIHVPPSSQMYSIFCVRTSSTPIQRVQNCTFLVTNTTTKLSAGNQNFMHNWQQATDIVMVWCSKEAIKEKILRHLSTGTSLAFCSVDIFKLKLKVSGEPTLIKRNENCCFAAFKSNYLLLITLFIINYYKYYY